MATQQPKAPPSRNEQIKGFVYYAFLISFAVHFIVGPMLPRMESRHEQEKIETVSVEHQVKVKVKPTPPPTPTPPPATPPPKETPPPKQVNTPQPEQPKIKINTVKTVNNVGGSGPTEAVNTHTEGSTNGVPQGTSTSAATAVPAATAAPPTATPAPACAHPNVQAHPTNPVTPDTPEMAKQQGAVGTTQVKVDLSAASKILGVSVYKSSGNQSLDQAALQAAKQSEFQTDIENCVPVARAYIYVVDFQ